MKKFLALILLILSAPVFAAVETTTVTGKIYGPDGSVVTSGNVRAQLSTSATTPDGASTSVVASRVSASIGSDGTVTLVLVPNDAMTPAGTYYTMSFTASTPISSTWTEKWVVSTAPDPVAIGSVVRVDTPPGLLPPISVIQDEGVDLVRRTKLNFVGTAIDCVPAADKVTCTVSGTGGGGGVPNATYITQTHDGTLTAEQALADLSTGIMKNTTGTGVVSIASAGDFPTLNQSTTGTSSAFTGSLVGDVTGTQGATTVGKINGTSMAGLATGIVKNTTGTGVPSIAVDADFPSTLTRDSEVPSLETDPGVPLLNLADLGDFCGPLQSTRRNAGDSANECYTPFSGSGTPGGSTGQLQGNNAGAFGGVPGSLYDTSTGAVLTKILNGTRVAIQYTTGTGVDLANAYTGWSSAITAGAGRVMFTGGPDGSVRYYDVPDSGISIPSNVEIAGDGNAILTWGPTRASVAPMLIVPVDGTNVTIRGLRFDPGVTVPACGMTDSTGGGSFIELNAITAGHKVSNVRITDNKFGVMRYSDGGNGCSDPTPFGVSINILGSATSVSVDHNTFDTAVANVYASDGTNSTQYTVDHLSVDSNILNWSQVGQGVGIGIAIGNGSASLTVPTNVQHISVTNNRGSLLTAPIIVRGNLDYCNVSDNNFSSLGMTGCIWVVHPFGLLPDGINYREPNKITITGNVCSDGTSPLDRTVTPTSSGADIRVSNVEGFTIIGNTIYGGQYNVGESHNGTVSSNSSENVLTSYLSHCVRLFGSSDVSVTGNTCRNATDVAIYNEEGAGLDYKNIVISGNDIFDSKNPSLGGGIVMSGDCVNCLAFGNIQNTVTDLGPVCVPAASLNCYGNQTYVNNVLKAGGGLSFPGSHTGTYTGTSLSAFGLKVCVTGSTLLSAGSACTSDADCHPTQVGVCTADALSSNNIVYAGDGINVEGTSAPAESPFNGSYAGQKNTHVLWTNPTALRTQTFPDATGTVALLASGQATSLSWGDGSTGSVSHTFNVSSGTDPVITGTPDALATNVGLTVGGGVDGTHGIQLDGNTATLENPLDNSKARIGFVGSVGSWRPTVRNFGGSNYDVLFGNGGDYGDFSCSGNSCLLDASGVGSGGSFTNSNVTVNSKGLITAISNGSSSSTNFIALTDTDPTTYSGQAGKVIEVNSGATGLDFTPVVSVTETSVAENDVLYYNASHVLVNKPSVLATETSPVAGQVLIYQGTGITGTANKTISGDATLALDGTLTVAAAVVKEADIGAGLQVVSNVVKTNSNSQDFITTGVTISCAGTSDRGKMTTGSGSGPGAVVSYCSTAGTTAHTLVNLASSQVFSAAKTAAAGWHFTTVAPDSTIGFSFTTVQPTSALGYNIESAAADALTMDGATADANKTHLRNIDPTADRVVSFPDANGVVALVHTSAAHGIVYWGVKTATNAAFDSGDEVCQDAGLTCSTTNDVLGTPIACNLTHTVIDNWLAFCK